VIASPTASFYPAYLAAGLSPDGGLTYMLPRLVGLRRAQQILLQNTPLDAAAALQAGLITDVVEDAALEQTVREIAQGLARAPRHALAAAKRLLTASLTATLETQLDAESMSIARLALTPDGRDGVAALLAKRKPIFE
jgi:2-(1,2-epoxy-1,2-dihydrophenyl)acetyl-CoA isomerase